MRRTLIRLASFGVLGAALAVLVAACAGLSTGSTAAPTTTIVLPAAEDDIAASYVKFFDFTQPVADKIGLLENGQQYQKELEALAASPLGKTVSISLSSVTISSPTTAEVKYSILIGGQPALPDQVGKAILEDGVWKVGTDSFLALLALQQGSTTPSS